MQKFIFLVFVLFFMAVSAASTIDDEFDHIDKRNNVCPQQYKRNVLGRRNYVKKCSCALASANFEGDKANGIIVYAQDECGTTTVTGFLTGLNPSVSNYTFQVVDDCGQVIRDLGSLGANFEGGKARGFAQKFTDLNLNCDKNGILFTKSGVLNKRNYCPKYYKRQGEGGSYTRVQGGDGASYGQASNAAL